MKALKWQRYLDEQRRLHGKVLFTVAELANVSGASLNALNVELTRLRQQGLIIKYAHGLYGLPNSVSPEALLSAIDSHAYITGSYALHLHNLITQVPSRITCFTDKRSPKAQERHTAIGRFVFICVRSRVYAPSVAGTVVSPAQAFCDFIYLMHRQGVATEGLVTFRNLPGKVMPELEGILNRYPKEVQKKIRATLASASSVLKS